MTIDLTGAQSARDFQIGDVIEVSDKMQSDYSYVLTAPMGEDFDQGFAPELSPQDMLEKGVFEGKYLNDCTAEFPREWFETALKTGKLSPERPDITCNYFGIKSRQPLLLWKQKRWITPDDPDVRGWFQWYCRYYLGRRDPLLDERQIKRWRAFRRHKGQILKNCERGDLSCRPRQRQGLLQWAYDPFF